MRGETMRDPATPRETQPGERERTAQNNLAKPPGQPRKPSETAPDYVAKIPREETAWNKLTR
jgi:hypothetical protein